jgi:hypothetical protein
MSSEVGFKGNFFVLTPTNPASVPNGSIFLDSTNGNSLTTKDTTGASAPIGAVSSNNIFIKQMQAAGAIAINRPVSKLSNGKIEAAEADIIAAGDYIGYALQAASADGDLINVLCVGANLIGALTGLGYTPGDEVYLSQDGNGFTNDPNTLPVGTDAVIKLGIADCSAGAASTVVNDLIVFSEVVSRP